MIAARRLLSLLAALLVVGLWAVALRPDALGGPALYVIVRGDSMLPTYSNGDLVIFHVAERYAVGDIVAYRVPAGEIGAGRIVIHRIVGGGDTQGFVLQGDNNPSADPWQPSGADVVGSAWLKVAGVGRGLTFIRQPVVLGGLAAACVVGMIVARRPTRRAGAASGRRLQPLPASASSPGVRPSPIAG